LVEIMNHVTVRQVKLSQLSMAPSGELAENVRRICDFCGKDFIGQKVTDRLAGHDGYYCSFCLRHRLHTKNASNVLGLSFRGVIGYYFSEYYQQVPKPRMWLAEIRDFIDCHIEVGMTNPLWSYDPETLLWVLDFSRVGVSKRKIRVEEMLKTVINVLACFNLPQEVPGVRLYRFYSKFKDAIMQFHTKRYRPNDRRLLIPTLSGCLNIEPRHIDRTRNITFSEMFC